MLPSLKQFFVVVTGNINEIIVTKFISIQGRICSNFNDAANRIKFIEQALRRYLNKAHSKNRGKLVLKKGQHETTMKYR